MGYYKYEPANVWTIKNFASQHLIRKLERLDDSTVNLGEFRGLGLQDVRLIVPKDILVYEVLRPVREKGEFFFTVREGNDLNPAYLSHMEVVGLGSANPVNLEVLKYPWYNNKDSSTALYRLSTGCEKRADLGLVSHLEIQKGQHPLLP